MAVEKKVLIKPKSVMVKDVDGVEKEFIISRMPAVDGREVLSKYPIANMPKLGDFGVASEARDMMFQYIAAPMSDGEHETLRTRGLINSHVSDGEQHIRLELEMLRYNTSFFGAAGSSDLAGSLLKRYLPLIIQTLMDSLPPSLVQGLRDFQNSKPS